MHRALKESEAGSDLTVVPAAEPGRSLSVSDDVGPAGSGSAEQETSQPDQILRFQKSERVLHWSIAVPFMVCYATGMVLMLFFNLHSGGMLRQALSWVHRIAGAAMILFPGLTVARHWREYRVHLYNIKHAWSWTTGDMKWLALMLPASVNRRIGLPDQGKFNAAEKVNFLMVLCTYPLFIASGLLIWMLEGGVLFWMAHVAMALLATPLMFGHIFMALVNPGTRVGLSGMISGYVDRHWARHHYRLWYEENFEEKGKKAEETKKEACQDRSQDAIVVVRFATRRSVRGDQSIGLSLQAVHADRDGIGGTRGGGAGC